LSLFIIRGCKAALALEERRAGIQDETFEEMGGSIKFCKESTMLPFPEKVLQRAQMYPCWFARKAVVETVSCR